MARLSDVLSELPGVTLAAWEADRFATFEFAGLSASQVARLVDEALTGLFNLGNDSVDGELSRV